MAPVIKVQGLGKRYTIGGSADANQTFREMLVQSVSAPIRRLRQLAGQSVDAISHDEAFWALKDVNFEVKQGEVVGIIGRNGAGKSTLLKILSRITEPTEGRVEIRGRVASLLEVGTGFHPELTGHENIYLNGAILGMSSNEISRKFDEIVAFAEVERFLDTPVKRYSSGMYVRLAFAVAAYLEPEILVVDEVLAVGDAAFQKKCLGKMSDVAKEGRTVLFVSHNMAAVTHLCSRALQIHEGLLAEDGVSEDVVVSYLRRFGTGSDDGVFSLDRGRLNAANDERNGLLLTDIELFDQQGEQLLSVGYGDGVTIRLHYHALRELIAPAFMVAIHDQGGTELSRLSTMPISGYFIDHLDSGKGHIDLQIESLPFTGGTYYLSFGVARANVEWIVRLDQIAVMQIDARDVYASGVSLDYTRGLIALPHQWTHG